MRYASYYTYYPSAPRPRRSQIGLGWYGGSVIHKPLSHDERWLDIAEAKAHREDQRINASGAGDPHRDVKLA